MTTAHGRRTVVEVRVLSVMRVSFSLSLALWAVAGVGLLALYGIGAVAGGLGGFRGFVTTIGLGGVWANPIAFVVVFAAAALLASSSAAVLAGLGAMLFNALVPLVGGIEVGVRQAANEMRRPASEGDRTGPGPG